MTSNQNSSGRNHIQECLAHTDYAEVAIRRTNLEGEIWDITTPDEQTTVRLADDDGTIYLYIFTGGKAQLNAGAMRFEGALAAPIYVAAVVDQIVADYL